MNQYVKVKAEDKILSSSLTNGKKCQKKKRAEESKITNEGKPVLKQEIITDHMPVVKKKRKIDRFNGMPEEEVVLKTLPDRLAPNLDILIIGINPGLYAAYIGHHYAGPGNHFWKCLYLSGLIPEPMNCYDDIKLQEFGIGFTNICARTTKGSADLKKPEIQEGSNILREKLKAYKPRIAVFNGKGIYEIFSGNKKFTFGKQPGLIEGTNSIAYVMPSSSARCAQLPRAVDKVPFYEALKKLRDYVVGRIPYLDDIDVTFPTLELKIIKKELDLNAENDDEGESSMSAACYYGNVQEKNEGVSQSTVHQNGAAGYLQSPVKQMEKRLNRSSDTGELKEEQRSDYQLGLTESLEQQQQFFHVPEATQQYLGPFQTTTGLYQNPCSQTNFASLQPATSASSVYWQTFQPTYTSLPGFLPETFVSATSPHDFMSGLYMGPQHFGMVGFPRVVPTTENMPGPQILQIKSEPMDPGEQN